MDWPSTNFKHNCDLDCMRDETNAMVGAQELCLPKEKAQETEDQLQKESRRWEE